MIAAAQLPCGCVEHRTLLKGSTGSGLRLLRLYFLEQGFPDGGLYRLWRHDVSLGSLLAVGGLVRFRAALTQFNKRWHDVSEAVVASLEAHEGHAEIGNTDLLRAFGAANLYSAPAGSEQEKRRRSAAISRKLRLLRAHGLLQKVSRTHRYQVTTAARKTITALLTARQATLAQLSSLAA